MTPSKDKKQTQETQTAQDTMPILAHLAELRTRLLWVIIIMTIGSAVSFLFVDEIYGFLVAPLAHAMKEGDTNRLIYTNLTEGFFTYIKVAFFAGVFITFPALLIQVWLFIAPGLYGNEKRALLPFLIATPLLFFSGAACVYYLVLPMAWPFFLSFQVSGEGGVLPIQLEARVSEYLDLIMTMIFAFGICFELPVLLVLLGRVGIVTADGLAHMRKYVIIVIFIVAAILTPPDIMSQFMLAIPMMLLYEVSILMIRLSGPKNDDQNAA